DAVEPKHRIVQGGSFRSTQAGLTGRFARDACHQSARFEVDRGARQTTQMCDFYLWKSRLAGVTLARHVQRSKERAVEQPDEEIRIHVRRRESAEKRIAKAMSEVARRNGKHRGLTDDDVHGSVGFFRLESTAGRPEHLLGRVQE